jgi:acetolactate synthase-1/2/3 large subunit
MYYLGALWTMGHYDIPILTIVHNNRGYYNSMDHRMTLAEYRGRDMRIDRARIGTGLVDPTPDYATIAEGLGVTGFGPVEDPDELGPVVQEAWQLVTEGHPVLVDVICEPR